MFLGIAPAAASPGGCVASDPDDVTVSSKTNTVTITDDPDTGGNNVGCYKHRGYGGPDHYVRPQCFVR